MNSINAFLLSKLAKNERFGHDVASLHRRYEILSIIYLNFGFSLLAVVYNSLTVLFLKTSHPYLMFAVCLPLSGLSLFFLKHKMFNMAALFLVLEMHASNTIATNVTNLPSAALYGAMIYPFFISFLSSSLWIHSLNTILCLAEHCLNSYRVLQIFEVTLTDEQTKQIYALLLAGMLGIVFACVTSVVQKFVEMTIWALAQESHEKNENLTKEVVQAMEAKDAFVSMLSHEIRNPLNSLKGSVDYLLEVVKGQSYIQVLRNAKLSGEILLNLVSNVLDAAKLKSDKMEMVYMETNFVETIKKVFIINSENLKGKGLFGEGFIDEKIPPFIWIDASRLLQIIMNLVSNAIKFTPKGGKINIYASWLPPNYNAGTLLDPLIDLEESIFSNGSQPHTLNSEPSIRFNSQNFLNESFQMEEFDPKKSEDQHKRLQYLTKIKIKGINDLHTLTQFSCQSTDEPWALHRTCSFGQDSEIDGAEGAPAQLNQNTRSKGYLKIQVTDTGYGIAEHDLPKLFGMFEQAAQGIRSASGGTGLGLYICKQICQKMNGEIKIYSKVDKGTSFVFYIPVDNETIVTNSIARPRAAGRDRVKAIVADDYAVNRYLHRLLLEQQGVQVTIARNGKEAVDKYIAQSDELDLILMDVQMPVMDGFAAAKAIREWEAEHNKNKVDIFFVTGEYFNEEEIMTGFRSRGGLNEGIRCMRKPLDTEMIKRAIAKYT